MISVIVPAYNVESYLHEAMNSVLQQTELPDELIVIDDGSNDSTGAIADSYSWHPIVKVIHTRNRGQGPARNYGVEISRSEYIYFFDADDLVEPNFISEMNKLISKHNADIVFFSGRSFVDGYEGGYTNSDNARGFSKIFDDGCSAVAELLRRDKLFASPCLYVFRKDLWVRWGLGFKNILHEDKELIFPMTALAEKVVVDDREFFNRRVRSDSTMTSDSLCMRRFKGRLEVLDSLVAFKSNHVGCYNKIKAEWRQRVHDDVVSLLSLGKELELSIMNRVVIKAVLSSLTPRFVLRLAYNYFK